MDNQATKRFDPADIPLPLLECGDWVALAEPYSVSVGSLAPGVRQALEALVEQRARELGDDGLDYPQTIDYARRLDDYADLFTFTHGTVVETVTTYNITDAARSASHAARMNEAYGDRRGPASNVSLRLHNPETGLAYIGSGGCPEYVDFSTEALILKHKSADSWGQTYDLPVADVLDYWGIPYLDDLAPNRGGAE
jgi:hypothetical protein